MKTVLLGDVCEFKRGLTYKKTDEVESSDNIVLRANNINLTTLTLDLSELRYIKNSIKIPDSKKLKRNALLICTASGSKSHLGKVAFIDNDYDYAFGGFMGLLVPYEKLIYPRYFYRVLTSSDFRRHLDELTDGANINNLRFSLIENYEIYLPPIEEQKKTVKKLDEAFEKIDKAIELTQKNLQNSQELFSRFLDSCLECKDGWVKKQFGEVTNLKQGLAVNAKTKHLLVEKSGIPLLRIKDLKENSFSQFVDEKKCPESVKVQKNDILYTRTGQVGLVFRGFEGALHNNSFKITSDNSVISDLVFWFLQKPSFKSNIISLASRTAQPDITHKIFKIQSLCFPSSIKQQREIVSTIERSFEQTQKLQKLYQKKLDNLEELKQSMLKQAFEGKL